MKIKLRSFAGILNCAFVLGATSTACVGQVGLTLIDDVHRNGASRFRVNDWPAQSELGTSGIATVRTFNQSGPGIRSNAFRLVLTGTNASNRQVAFMGWPDASALLSSNALNAAEAQLLARRLVAARFDIDVQGAGFRLAGAPTLVAGRWTCVWRRGSGTGDIELTVSFDANGASPEVHWRYLTAGGRAI